MGKPSNYYPWNWSIYEWITGKSANNIPLIEIDLNQISIDLAEFLNELHDINFKFGPKPGIYNFYRGGDLLVYNEETKTALELLKKEVYVDKILKCWEIALSTKWNKDPIWIHGDLSSGNIIINKNKLTSVIDFGGMAKGDPACDLVIAWTFLSEKSRKIFKSKLKKIDSNTWDRAKGWCLWKALITLKSLKINEKNKIKKQKKIINDVIKEF